MADSLISKAACIADLKAITKARIPKFAFEYLAGGCNDENTLRQNRRALDQVYLQPQYLATSCPASLTTELMGRQYAAPFGVAPLGLSGLVWPRAAEYQARAAKEANIPYILSTLASTSIERAAECAGDNFWFQLYPPSDLAIRKDLMARAKAVNCQHLVVTIDVPAAGRRPKDIRNGLAVPPKISVKSIAQTMLRPAWAMATVRQGMPQFASMMPYMKDISNLREVANYIRTTLKDVVDLPMLQQLREDWSGKLIVKGVLSVADAQKALEAGADAIIVSNHGGRQLDAARPSVTALEEIVAAVGDKMVVMVDSGVESGPDIARFLAQGAQMVFAGRAFMYGVGAFGEPGAAHCIDLLRQELLQVMEQLRCPTTTQLPNYLL
ncbi:MAG: alpha-hydroxy-acid oxidizing protein [Pseudomonadales bacterium]|nr:alpha-hydroxy-acid oxidizing protein [Pseudomonadales bacterium]NRA17937.1 alpha-hydroxy-acid oxidizing protein [Oceanospirillaceae bacterium]